jgi:hypothetical protein
VVATSESIRDPFQVPEVEELHIGCTSIYSDKVRAIGWFTYFHRLSRTLTLNSIDGLNQIKKAHPNSVPLAMPITMGPNSNNTYALISDIAVAILSPYMGIS